MRLNKTRYQCGVEKILKDSQPTAKLDYEALAEELAGLRREGHLPGCQHYRCAELRALLSGRLHKTGTKT